ATVAKLPVAGARRGYRSVRFAKRFLSFAELPEETAFRRSYTMYDRAELLRLVNPDLAATVDDVLTEHADVYHDQALDDFVNRMCLADARMFLPGLNLAYTDRASMAASTEVRVPFVDVKVVEAAFALAGKDKVAGRHGKLALRKAAEAGLPRGIVHRPKGLFSAPLRAWMSRDLAPVRRGVVHDGAWSPPGCCGATRCACSPRKTPRAGRTAANTSGTCSRSSTGTAAPPSSRASASRGRRPRETDRAELQDR